MTLSETVQQYIDAKTKPPGSLGVLEHVALQIALIQQTTKPVIINPHIVVFAADHGIAATNLVNPYPQQVTAQMVANFLSGGAAINVFCRQHNIALKVVDAGVAFDFSSVSNPHFVSKKIAHGTKNYLLGPAMTRTEAERAIQHGRDVVESIAAQGCNTIGFGEMGIGNTSSAALLMSVVLKRPIEECVGRGTGASDTQLQTKLKTLQAVLQKHHDVLQDKPDALMLLSCFGGFETGMLCGAFLQAAESGMVVLVDGFIATAALLLAHIINPSVLQYCLFAHCSGEQGHRLMLEYLSAKPLLQLGLRLGEGTGAALAFPLVQSAVAFLAEMASFESAGIDNKNT